MVRDQTPLRRKTQAMQREAPIGDPETWIDQWALKRDNSFIFFFFFFLVYVNKNLTEMLTNC